MSLVADRDVKIRNKSSNSHPPKVKNAQEIAAKIARVKVPREHCCGSNSFRSCFPLYIKAHYETFLQETLARTNLIT